MRVSYGRYTSKLGRAEAVNILTHTSVLRAPLQGLAFFIARRSRWLAENVAGTRSQALQLKRLNFLYSARWVRLGSRWNVFSSFPSAHLPMTRWEWPHRRWVLFASNFNQGWDPYFHAFLDSFGSGVHFIWSDSSHYPGYPAPRTRYETIDWTYERLVPSQHYYCAYPTATANDVRAALRVDRELRACVEQRGDGLHPDGPDTDELLSRIQTCLGRSSEEGVAFTPAKPGPEDTGVFGFVSVVR